VPDQILPPPDPLCGPVPTLWDGDGIEAAVHDSRDLLLAARPDVVDVHTWSIRQGADLVRAILPDVRLVAGVGVDGIARQVALKQRTVAQGIATFHGLARQAADVGALGITWNAEVSYKRPPTRPEKARLHDLVTGALQDVKAAFPLLRQFHTSYDHPSYHPTYDWSGWLGEGSPVEASFFQVYAAPGDGRVMAHRGALPKRKARAFTSYQATVKARRIRPDAPDGTPGDLVDLDWRPYFQLHSVPGTDTVRESVRYPVVFLWALRSRTDAEGRLAFLALCELHRRGYWGAGGVGRFQTWARDQGLYTDRIDEDCGPKTRRALGLAE
jgi:hypothetical protein